jgi:hypothetical protein
LYLFVPFRAIFCLFSPHFSLFSLHFSPFFAIFRHFSLFSAIFHHFSAIFRHFPHIFRHFSPFFAIFRHFIIIFPPFFGYFSPFFAFFRPFSPYFTGDIFDGEWVHGQRTSGTYVWGRTGARYAGGFRCVRQWLGGSWQGALKKGLSNGGKIVSFGAVLAELWQWLGGSGWVAVALGVCGRLQVRAAVAGWQLGGGSGEWAFEWC